jgi:hypothetical protein
VQEINKHFDSSINRKTAFCPAKRPLPNATPVLRCRLIIDSVLRNAENHRFQACPEGFQGRQTRHQNFLRRYDPDQVKRV